MWQTKASVYVILFQHIKIHIPDVASRTNIHNLNLRIHLLTVQQHRKKLDNRSFTYNIASSIHWLNISNSLLYLIKTNIRICCCVLNDCVRDTHFCEETSPSFFVTIYILIRIKPYILICSCIDMQWNNAIVYQYFYLMN